MKIVVNGTESDLPDHTTIADVVESLGHNPTGRGLAAALNGEVVSRSRWSETALHEGDRVEILVAVGGG